MRMRKFFENILRSDANANQDQNRFAKRSEILRIFAKCEFAQNAIFAKCEFSHANFSQNANFRKMRIFAKSVNASISRLSSNKSFIIVILNQLCTTIILTPISVQFALGKKFS